MDHYTITTDYTN